MSLTSSSVSEPVEQVPPGAKRSRMPWMLLGLIAIGAIAGLALWIGFAGEDGPTVTFDGQTATYSGSTTLSAGDVTFTFDATEYANSNGVTFQLGELIDDSITIGVIRSAAAAVPASAGAPPFIGTQYSEAVVGDVVEVTFPLSEGRWTVVAITAPQDTDRVHPAVILEVTGN